MDLYKEITRFRQDVNDAGLYGDESAARFQLHYTDIPEGEEDQWAMLEGTQKGMMTHRDISNMEVVLEALEKYPDQVVRARGGERAVKVLEPDGSLTPAGEELQGFMGALMDYPVLDDEEVSRREYEETIDNIDQEGWGSVREDAPEDWAKQVFSWLWENNQTALEPDETGVAWVPEEEIREALDALGYLERDEEEPGPEPVDPRQTGMPGVESKMKSELKFDGSGRVQKGLEGSSVARIASAMQKQAQAGTHEGYKNYETWAVALYINNDRGEYEYWTEQVEDLKSEGGAPSEVWTPEESVKFGLADLMKTYFEEMLEGVDLMSPFSELLNGALGEVYWDEVAEDFLAE